MSRRSQRLAVRVLGLGTLLTAALVVGVAQVHSAAPRPKPGLIAFSLTVQGEGEAVATVRSDGTKVTRIRTVIAPYLEPAHPTWSPDGKRIAFLEGSPPTLEVMRASDGLQHPPPGTGIRPGRRTDASSPWSAWVA